MSGEAALHVEGGGVAVEQEGPHVAADRLGAVSRAADVLVGHQTAAVGQVPVPTLHLGLDGVQDGVRRDDARGPHHVHQVLPGSNGSLTSHRCRWEFKACHVL